MSVWLYPYKQGSRSATALAADLGIRTIRLQGSKFQPNRSKTIINWGSTTLPQNYLERCRRVINPPENIARASNKLTFFETISAQEEAARARIPRWTLDRDTVRGWLAERNKPLVFARTILTGHSGAGIVKITNEEELAAVAGNPLFVDYIPKRMEFRLHFLNGEVISMQEKKARVELPEDFEVDWQIRNHDNGFIFARENVNPPEDVILQSKLAIEATGLDFGAVDVIYNKRLEQAFVLEVNTSPGLEGTTLANYSEALRAFTAND